jgi:4-diphosphocytidyl-2-C-methyl-D-erythritol kinase
LAGAVLCAAGDGDGMTIRTIAPAKINWTLEVLGKRPDGYHEIRSVMQTIDLCDEITIGPAETLTLEVRGPHTPADDDHTLQAARLLGEAVDWEPAVTIHVEKRIPVSAGLGGGSSDAAAVLRGLRALRGLDTPDAKLAGIAAGIGSDAPFFLRGGTALTSGRGEVTEPLQDVPETWLVVLVPPITLADKTRRMYAALAATDFSDGLRTADLVTAISRGVSVDPTRVFNAFDQAASRMFENVAAYRTELRDASGSEPHLAGAGPALFSVCDSRDEADCVAGRLEGSEARVFVARTLGAVEATRIF